MRIEEQENSKAVKQENKKTGEQENKKTGKLENGILEELTWDL